MKKNVLISIILALMCLNGYSQLTVQIDKTFGGDKKDWANKAKQTLDGGYIIVGGTESFGARNADIYIIKIDRNGDTLWTKRYDSENIEYICSNTDVILTADGGYVIGATIKTPNNEGTLKVFKIDQIGNLLWSKTYGNGDLNNIAPTRDGGYIICSCSDRIYTNFPNNVTDNYVLKINEFGEKEWDTVYNLSSHDEPDAILQTHDGDYIMCGSGSVVKMNSFGREIKITKLTYGGGRDIQITEDGGYIICGWGSRNQSFLAKLDSNLNIEWEKKYQHNSYNYFSSIKCLADDNYIIAGEAIGGNTGNYDFYLVKTNSKGEIIWEKTFGGAGEEWATSIEIANDGGYILTGPTTSFGKGGKDVWFLKVLEVERPSYIKGKLYADNNDNCKLDKEIDRGVSRRMIKAEPGPFITFTDNEGNYSFKTKPGKYTVSWETNEDAYYDLNDCETNNNQIVKIKSGETIDNINISGNLLQAHPCEASVKIVSSGFEIGACGAVLSSPCPGYKHRYNISLTAQKIKNKSILTIVLPKGMTPIGVPDICPALSNYQYENITNTMTWNINASINGGIDPDPTAEVDLDCLFDILVETNINSLSPYIISSRWEYKCKQGDPSIIIGDTVTDFDTCSCDPNDLSVTPTGCGPNGNISKNEDLTYRVRFHNIGNGSAKNIVIKDTLDNNFDLSSLRIIESSHNITNYQIEPNNVLAIYYDGINLPADTIDKEGSQGYVWFNVEPKANLAEGTVIKNAAAVYFDKNEPVITNTVMNTLWDVPSPIADFSSIRQRTSIDNKYDFTYTGGTETDATYEWNFGSDAIPSTSTTKNPIGILFNTSGQKEITLTVNRRGCSATITKTFDVINVRCGKNGEKVLVCHMPNNSNNPQIICVDPRAVPAHIAHGDCIGECPIAKKSMELSTQEVEKIATSEFDAAPNPFKESTTISFTSIDDEYTTLTVFNYSGQQVASLFNGIAKSGERHEVKLDSKNLNPGLYFAILQTKTETKTIKLSVLKQ